MKRPRELISTRNQNPYPSDSQLFHRSPDSPAHFDDASSLLGGVRGVPACPGYAPSPARGGSCTPPPKPALSETKPVQDWGWATQRASAPVARQSSVVTFHVDLVFFAEPIPLQKTRSGAYIPVILVLGRLLRATVSSLRVRVRVRVSVASTWCLPCDQSHGWRLTCGLGSSRRVALKPIFSLYACASWRNCQKIET